MKLLVTFLILRSYSMFFYVTFYDKDLFMYILHIRLFCLILNGFPLISAQNKCPLDFEMQSH